MEQDKSKNQQFSELEPLLRRIANEEAVKVYQDKGTRWGVAEVPIHVHNGVDSPQLSEDNIILTTKLQTQLIVTNTGGSPSTDSVTIKNVSSVSRISFHGYAANNAGGGAATLKAMITGEIIFGKCFNLTGSSPIILVNATPPASPYKYSCDFIFIDTTDLTKAKVGTAPYLAYNIDGAGAEMTKLYLTGFTNDSLTFSATLAAGWKLEGNIIIE